MKGSELYTAATVGTGLLLLLVAIWKRPAVRTGDGWILPSVALYGYLAAGLAAAPLSIALVPTIGAALFGPGLASLSLAVIGLGLAVLSVVSFVLYALIHLVLQRPILAAALALLLHVPLTLGVGPVIADGQAALRATEQARALDPSNLSLRVVSVTATRGDDGRLTLLRVTADVVNNTPDPLMLQGWSIEGVAASSAQEVEDVLKQGGALGPPLLRDGVRRPVRIESGINSLVFEVDPGILARLDLPDGEYELVLEVGIELRTSLMVSTR